jgi:hypothetical protein
MPFVSATLPLIMHPPPLPPPSADDGGAVAGDEGKWALCEAAAAAAGQPHVTSSRTRLVFLAARDSSHLAESVRWKLKGALARAMSASFVDWRMDSSGGGSKVFACPPWALQSDLQSWTRPPPRHAPHPRSWCHPPTRIVYYNRVLVLNDGCNEVHASVVIALFVAASGGHILGFARVFGCRTFVISICICICISIIYQYFPFYSPIHFPDR